LIHQPPKLASPSSRSAVHDPPGREMLQQAEKSSILVVEKAKCESQHPTRSLLARVFAHTQPVEQQANAQANRSASSSHHHPSPKHKKPTLSPQFTPVLKTLPKHGQATFSVRFLLPRPSFHLEVFPSSQSDDLHRRLFPCNSRYSSSYQKAAANTRLIAA